MTTLGQSLLQEHRALESLYEEVANRAHCGDTAALDASWAGLEARLLAHMDFEEAQLFTRFELAAPAEATRLLNEHGQVRRALEEMGVALELHALREETVGEFLALLRAHGAREERLLYPWSSTLEAAPCEAASSAPLPGKGAP